MRTINALGFVEVHGLVAGIEAADAMLKTAQVRVLRRHGVDPGMISLVVEGDLAACRAAVDAGVAAASQIGVVIASHVIGRPDPDTERLIVDLLAEPVPPVESAIRPEMIKQEVKPEIKPEVKPTPKPAERKPARNAAKAKTPVPPRGLLADVLAFIAEADSGRTWKELKARFPGLSQQTRKQLDAAVASGQLVKAGARYRNKDLT